MLSVSDCRSSRCSSRTLSASTRKTYDSDVESSGFQQNEKITNSSNNESLSAVLLPLTTNPGETRQVISSCDSGFFQDSTRSVECDSETETSTSGTCTSSYTERDYRSLGDLCEETLLGRTHFESVESQFDATNSVDTLTRQCSQVSECDVGEKSRKGLSFGPENTACVENLRGELELTKAPCIRFESQAKNVDAGCSTPNADKSGESKLTYQEILQKQRELRDNFKKLLNEARKSVREWRAKQSAVEASPRRATAAGKTRNGGESKQTSVVKRSRLEGKPTHRKNQGSVKRNREKTEILITELSDLNLIEQASTLEDAWVAKENQEREHDILLKAIRQNNETRKKREMRQKKEDENRKRLEEIRKIEEQKEERQEYEKRRKAKEEVKRREKNRMLWESYHEIALTNSISRSYTFSYFPKLTPKLEEPTEGDPFAVETTTVPAKVSETRKKQKKCYC